MIRVELPPNVACESLMARTELIAPPTFVDGSTILGTGAPGDPLRASGGGGFPDIVDTPGLSVAIFPNNGGPSLLAIVEDGLVRSKLKRVEYQNTRRFETIGMMGVTSGAPQYDNVNLTAGNAGLYDAAPSANCVVTGFTRLEGFKEGFIVHSLITTNFSVTLKHLDASSLPEHQIVCSGGGNIAIGPFGGWSMIYYSAKWRLLSYSP